MRGKKRRAVITFALPKSSPAQSPLPVCASKKVVMSPSKTFWIVLPLLLYEPLVPMTAPVSLLLCGPGL